MRSTSSVVGLNRGLPLPNESTPAATSINDVSESSDDDSSLVSSHGLSEFETVLYRICNPTSAPGISPFGKLSALCRITRRGTAAIVCLFAHVPRMLYRD